MPIAAYADFAGRNHSMHLENSLDPRQNKLIAALPPAVIERIGPQLEPFWFSNGDVIMETAEPIDAVYFPSDLVASFEQVVTLPGESFDLTPGVALTGNEGALGVELYLGGQTAINRATVRMAGMAFRIKARPLREEFARGGALQRLLLKAADALFAQISGTAACERLHTTAQRVTRWLLVSHDRANGKDLMWTQDSLAHLIGVRRESISIAARQLQADGLIKYQRGSIMIVDRERLEAQACQCYREIKTRYDLLYESESESES